MLILMLLWVVLEEELLKTCPLKTLPDKTMQQVLSKSADIGLCGPEQIIYIYNQKKRRLPCIICSINSI